MFTYYDGRFARDLPLLFHCANVKHRHAANQAVNDADFQGRLARARADPKSREAKQVLREVVGFLNLAASKVPWGQRERAGEITTLLAGQRSHGAASWFYTLAPDDVHWPLAVRLAFPHMGFDAFPYVEDAAFLD